MRTTSAVLIALQCSMIAACGGGGGGTDCVRDDQCASHFCRADGTCGPADVDAAPGTDTLSIDSMGGACSPDHDGHITIAEVPLVPGRMANFRIATNATVSTAGTSHTDGTRSWDLSPQLSGDATSAIALASPIGAWWATDFPTATYATTLSASSDLIGVFHVGPSVTLLGVVSPAGGTFQTKLTYDPPAEILKLPFANGDAWTSTSSVSGQAQGAFTAYSETYDSRVDQVGTMTTPYGAFPVLRVATDLTRTSGLATLTSNRTFAWVAECFGTVATIQSQAFESGSEFTDAAEVRRLAP